MRAWLTSAVLLWALQSVVAGLWAALHLGLAVRSRRGGAGWAATVLLPWWGAWRAGARARAAAWWALGGIYLAAWWVGRGLA